MAADGTDRPTTATAEPAPPRRASRPGTPLRERALAPDVARGAMLLFIVIANSPFYLWGRGSASFGSNHPEPESAADAVAQAITMIAIDARSYPMFAFLFGYGIWQLFRRQVASSGEAEARRILRRRHWWMVAFGAAHALLLWMGDIIGAYGLAGLVLVALFIRRRDRTIVIWCVVLLALLVQWAALSLIGGIVVAGLPEAEAGLAATDGGMLPTAAGIEDPLLAALARLGFWAVLAPAQGLLGMVVPLAILLAVLAARRGVLEEPERHRRLLRLVAGIGIPIGWVVGAVSAATHLGAIPIPEAASWMLLGVHQLAGLACGLGYVAVFALIAAHVRERMASGGAGPGGLLRALQALGQRSLTFYLVQSLVFAPLMSAWALGLGEHLTTATITLVAVATWLATLGIAAWMGRAGLRGPAEVLLRRLAYGGRPAAPTGSPPPAAAPPVSG